MTTEEQIKKMYESQLNSQKEQLTTDYQNANSKLDEQIRQNEKTADKNLNRTAVEAQKAAVSNEEYYNASGLSSGARAQARLSQENQALANMTAIRNAQQEADAQVERSRGLLAKEYESAIRQAQAANDLELAKSLYEAAKEEEAKLLAKQEAAASLMAQSGDYTRYGDLYGLSAEEVMKLNKASAKGTGGGGGGSVSKYSGKANNGSLETWQVELLQDMLGVEPDGKWGPKTRQAAYELWGTTDPDEAWSDHSLDNGLYEARQAAPAPRNDEVAPRDRVDAFISRNMTREQAISRGIGETSWKAMILQALNKADLTEKEFAALEAYYGIS